MICFCYFCQNFFSALGMAHNDPFSVQIGSKKTIFKRFYQLFFRTAGLQHNLLILIVPPNILHQKSAKKAKWVWSLRQNLGQIRSNVVKEQTNWYFNRFFHILHEVYIYKQKGSGYINTSQLLWLEMALYSKKALHNLEKHS